MWQVIVCFLALTLLILFNGCADNVTLTQGLTPFERLAALYEKAKAPTPVLTEKEFLAGKCISSASQHEVWGSSLYVSKKDKQLVLLGRPDQPNNNYFEKSQEDIAQLAEDERNRLAGEEKQGAYVSTKLSESSDANEVLAESVNRLEDSPVIYDISVRRSVTAGGAPVIYLAGICPKNANDCVQNGVAIESGEKALICYFSYDLSGTTRQKVSLNQKAEEDISFLINLP